MPRHRVTSSSPSHRWQQMKNEVQRRWDLLTDADIDDVHGNAERLIDALQVRYGYGRRTALREINLWSLSLRTAS